MKIKKILYYYTLFFLFFSFHVNANGNFFSKKEISSSQSITFYYANISASKKNWIGIWKRQEAEGALNQKAGKSALRWQYVTDKKGDYTVSFKNLPPGEYAAFLMANDGYSWLAAPIFFDTYKDFNKSQFYKALSSRPENVLLNYGNITASETNWIGIWKLEDAQGALNQKEGKPSLKWQYARGRSGSYFINKKKLKPGHYVAFLMKNGGYSWLAPPIFFDVPVSNPPVVEQDPISSTRTPIVFIHGLLGNNNIWKPITKTLEQRGYREDIDYFYYTYDTTHVMANEGKKFVDWVKGKFRDKKIALVGHSMGGLIARYAVQGVNSGIYSLKEPLNNVTHVVTMATPHYGSPVALSCIAAAPTIASCFYSLYDLMPISMFIKRLNSDPAVNITNKTQILSIHGDCDWLSPRNYAYIHNGYNQEVHTCSGESRTNEQEETVTRGLDNGYLLGLILNATDPEPIFRKVAPKHFQVAESQDSINHALNFLDTTEKCMAEPREAYGNGRWIWSQYRICLVHDHKTNRLKAALRITRPMYYWAVFWWPARHVDHYSPELTVTVKKGTFSGQLKAGTGMGVTNGNFAALTSTESIPFQGKGEYTLEYQYKQNGPYWDETQWGINSSGQVKLTF